MAVEQAAQDVPYFGERPCARKGCRNRAYYRVGENVDAFWCGVHSKRDAQLRRELPKDPDAKRKRIDTLRVHEERIFEAKRAGVSGLICCHRLLMMRQVPLTDGFLNIFPNNRHAQRTDGRGMPALSPMRLGPVVHRQPGVPDALNIENYHQFSKVWPSELDGTPTGADPGKLPPPKASFYEARDRGYRDAEPHRHKFDPKKMEAERKNASSLAHVENRNAPAYALHATLDGQERRFTYVQSRYFYCVAYEQLAMQTPEFRQLRTWLNEGVSLQLCGYDAHDMGIDASPDDLYRHYCDATKPFGHERVLYALLALRNRWSEAYPWHRYRREHPRVYQNIAHVLLTRDVEPDVPFTVTPVEPVDWDSPFNVRDVTTGDTTHITVIDMYEYACEACQSILCVHCRAVRRHVSDEMDKRFGKNAPRGERKASPIDLQIHETRPI